MAVTAVAESKKIPREAPLPSVFCWVVADAKKPQLGKRGLRAEDIRVFLPLLPEEVSARMCISVAQEDRGRRPWRDGKPVPYDAPSGKIAGTPFRGVRKVARFPAVLSKEGLLKYACKADATIINYPNALAMTTEQVEKVFDPGSNMLHFSENVV